MIFSRNFKKYFSVLFCCIYFFAFLFSNNFHNHNSGYFLKSFDLKDTSTSFSKQNSAHNNEDCLSCHFVSTNFILPKSDAVLFLKPSDIKTEISYSILEVSSTSFHLFYLRGPPSFM